MVSSARQPGSRMPHTCRLLVLLALLVAGARGLPPVPSRKGVLLWQVQLSPEQCGSARWQPCYNVYAVNQSHGDLVWFAFTTDSAAIKGMFVGHHSVYYTTWSGPGLYTINAANGHVRWQFPLDNWFRYWVKDIDLDRSASFAYSAEVQNVVYVTAAGPPARLYGLRTKSGAKQWEHKLPNASAVLADLTGPLDGSDDRGSMAASSTGGSSSSGSGSMAAGGSGSAAPVGRGGSSSGAVYLALNAPASNSSWLQAVDAASGRPLWQSEALQGCQLVQLELQAGLLLAASQDAATLAAWDARDGALLWRREGRPYCSTPSPVAALHDDGRLLLLTDDCAGLGSLTALDPTTGQEQWRGWAAPGAARPAGNCSAPAVAGGSVFFGCACSIKAGWRWRPAASDGGGSDSNGASSNDGGDGGESASGVCLYALHSRSGRLRWVVPVPGNASFPEGAQAWGMAPLLRGGLAVFLASDRVIAVDAVSGKLRWALQLAPGEALQPFQLPAVDEASGALLLAARVAQQQQPSSPGGGRTALSAVALRDGRLLWRRATNGTAQPPMEGPAAGAQQLMAGGGRVHVEACRGTRCCLRALNASSGKQRWGMCLDAVQGDDATHPHAKFAIWLVTLVTVASIALLILGACLVYLQRWSEERRILYGSALPNSPRHSYQPLPARQSDSEDGE